MIEQHKFENELRSKLDNFELPVPDDVWASIENRTASPSRHIPLIIWWTTAIAAACIAIIMSLNVNNNGNTDEIASNGAGIQTSSIVEQSASNASAHKSNTHQLQANSPVTPKTTLSSTTTVSNDSAIEQQTTQKNVSHSSDDATQQEENSNTDKNKHNASQNNNLLAMTTEMDIPKRIHRGAIPSIHISGISMSDFSLSPGSDQSSILNDAFAGNGSDGYGNDGYYGIPVPKDTIYTDNNDAKRRAFSDYDKITDEEHDLPLRIGLSFQYHITSSFAIESGLEYTHLHSTLYYKNEAVEQNLNYFGIPANVLYTFHDTKKWNCYASTGIALDYLFWGNQGNNEIASHPIQFSTTAKLGVQYNVSNNFGIYIEPGVSYFFDDGSDLHTIYKQQPFEFCLRLGMRFDTGRK